MAPPCEIPEHSGEVGKFAESENATRFILVGGGTHGLLRRPTA